MLSYSLTVYLQMADKLKKKQGEGTSSVLEIARMIRGEVIQGEETVGSDETPVLEVGNETEGKRTLLSMEMETASPVFPTHEDNSDKMDLTELLEFIKSKDYTCKEVLYVDTDVKEVFGLLKAKAKIPISSLVSFILEDWLTKHRDDISSLIKQKKNRFL